MNKISLLSIFCVLFFSNTYGSHLTDKDEIPLFVAFSTGENYSYSRSEEGELREALENNTSDTLHYPADVITCDQEPSKFRDETQHMMADLSRPEDVARLPFIKALYMERPITSCFDGSNTDTISEFLDTLVPKVLPGGKITIEWSPYTVFSSRALTPQEKRAMLKENPFNAYINLNGFLETLRYACNTYRQGNANLTLPNDTSTQNYHILKRLNETVNRLTSSGVPLDDIYSELHSSLEKCDLIDSAFSKLDLATVDLQTLILHLFQVSEGNTRFNMEDLVSEMTSALSAPKKHQKAFKKSLCLNLKTENLSRLSNFVIEKSCIEENSPYIQYIMEQRFGLLGFNVAPYATSEANGRTNSTLITAYVPSPSLIHNFNYPLTPLKINKESQKKTYPSLPDGILNALIPLKLNLDVNEGE